MSQTIATKPAPFGTAAISRREKESRRLTKYGKALAPIVGGLALLLIPVPQGLTPNAWYYFALFVAVVIALILEPIPAAAVGLIGVTAATVSLLVTPKPADAIRWALSGFQDGTVWLIFVAYMFALGYEKTGLGRRVALNFVKRLGKRTPRLRLRRGPGGFDSGAVYAVEHGAERWNYFPRNQKHSSALRLRARTQRA